MAKAKSGMGSHNEEARRGKDLPDEMPREPGATGEGVRDREGASPEEALNEALHTRGKTGKHVSEDR
jgi:hypothetical protein